MLFVLLNVFYNVFQASTLNVHSSHPDNHCFLEQLSAEY